MSEYTSITNQYRGLKNFSSINEFKTVKPILEEYQETCEQYGWALNPVELGLFISKEITLRGVLVHPESLKSDKQTKKKIARTHQEVIRKNLEPLLLKHGFRNTGEYDLLGITYTNKALGPGFFLTIDLTDSCFRIFLDPAQEVYQSLESILRLVNQSIKQ